MFFDKYVFSLRVVDKFLNLQQIYLTVIKNKEFQKERKNIVTDELTIENKLVVGL